mgnify:CR=1 FL=1
MGKKQDFYADFKIIKPGKSLSFEIGFVNQGELDESYSIHYGSISFPKVTKGIYNGTFTFRNSEMESEAALSFLKRNQPLKKYVKEVHCITYVISKSSYFLNYNRRGVDEC